ncbi:uncharacterized protein PAC_19898 [Phialocephala subalpina]|uniref:Major facilitator superfamily (MFS) profile domain-containing protein n=1 Tax=Phialocephala subalpina TaxID=576137 RepID=A0A1L7XY98_9HELO|nr:uncharacterized protein PAC_19898 [Phialocephala subalpina]
MAQVHYIQDPKKSAEHEETIVLEYNDMTAQEKLQDKKLLRKIDLLILPLATLNYFFSSMDRNDIGNAKLAGFQTDNHLTNLGYSTVVAVFYAGYIPFQLVGGLGIRKVQPYIQLGLANIVWGIASIMMLFSKSIILPSLMRVLIGAAEGITQVNSVFLTMWYTPREYAVRTGAWYSCGVLAGTFNGLIAYGIQTNIHSSVFKSWQLIYLVEGCLPIGFGIVFIWLYPPTPELVKKFFSEEEKKLVIERTRRARNTPGESVTLKGAVSAFRQPHLYGMCLIYFCIIWTVSGYGAFLPSIINGLGFTRVLSQLLTVPITFAGFASVWVFCIWSDRVRKRGIFLVCLSVTAFIGYLILVIVPSIVAPRLVGLVLISIGIQPMVPLALTWLYTNTVGLSRRAMSIPLQNISGQLGGLAVSFTFVDPPRYFNGNLATLILLSVLIFTVVLCELYFVTQNRRKAAHKVADPAWVAENQIKSYAELGTDHPDFMYEN